MDKDNIDITANPESLTISGERVIEAEESRDEGFYKRERSYGSFSRTISLPGRIHPNKVTTKMDKGVLIIRLPKEK